MIYPTCYGEIMKQISHFDSVIENFNTPLEEFRNKYYFDKKSRFMTQFLIYSGLGFLGFYNDIAAIPNINPTPLAFYGAVGVLSAFCMSKNKLISTLGKNFSAIALASCCMSIVLVSEFENAALIYNLMPTVTETLPTLMRLCTASISFAVSEKALSIFD